jgi:hypothetical protein
MLGLHGRGKQTLNTGVAPSAPPCSFCRHSQKIAECACKIRVGGCVGGQHRLSSTAFRFSGTHNFFTNRRHLEPVNFEVRFDHEGNMTSPVRTSASRPRLRAVASCYPWPASQWHLRATSARACSPETWTLNPQKVSVFEHFLTQPRTLDLALLPSHALHP